MVDANIIKYIKLINSSSKYIIICKKDRVAIITNLYFFYLIFIKFATIIAALVILIIILFKLRKLSKQLNFLIIKP